MSIEKTVNTGLLDNEQPKDLVGPGGLFLQLPDSTSAHEYLRPTIVNSREKSWGDKMLYEAGVSYLTGVTLGYGVGAIQGWRKAGKSTNFKLKINSVLNSAGKLGSRTANAFGVFALVFSGSRSLIKHQRRKNDELNDIAGIVVAGTLTTTARSFLYALPVGLACGSFAACMVWGRLKIQELAAEAAYQEALERD